MLVGFVDGVDGGWLGHGLECWLVKGGLFCGLFGVGVRMLQGDWERLCVFWRGRGGVGEWAAGKGAAG